MLDELEKMKVKAEYWDKLLALYDETEKNANLDDFFTDVYHLKMKYYESLIFHE